MSVAKLVHRHAEALNLRDELTKGGKSNALFRMDSKYLGEDVKTLVGHRKDFTEETGIC